MASRGLDPRTRAAARGELLGRRVRVQTSADAGLVGVEGRIVDETLRTFVVELPSGRRMRLGKRESVFVIGTDSGEVSLPGAAIEYRPEDRTKKVR